jgi:hypothetical protein
MHSHAEPQTVEQFVVLKHFKDSNFGVSFLAGRGPLLPVIY